MEILIDYSIVVILKIDFATPSDNKEFRSKL